MKLAQQTKKPHAYPPRPGGIRPPAHHVPHDPGEHDEELVDTAGSHFSLTRKAAGITRKELAGIFGWSKTYIDGILNGSKNDPVEQCRKYCHELLRKKRVDLVGATLVEIAGGTDFDSNLFAAQIDAIKAFAKVVP